MVPNQQQPVELAASGESWVDGCVYLRIQDTDSTFQNQGVTFPQMETRPEIQNYVARCEAYMNEVSNQRPVKLYKEFLRY